VSAADIDDDVEKQHETFEFVQEAERRRSRRVFRLGTPPPATVATASWRRVSRPA
jgi:hypothetical protein